MTDTIEDVAAKAAEPCRAAIDEQGVANRCWLSVERERHRAGWPGRAVEKLTKRRLDPEIRHPSPKVRWRLGIAGDGLQDHRQALEDMR